ncbi:MAG: hypothetical protein GIW99_06255 [Candidatus Eremiobacteraeota bacterium]|nr:hypothetical protein [Candidatus Eremiobacteraeota bacterium]MBC5827270.1 hypothetical protein [Candidatus Eremiobacteraeota bacterium]
MPRPLGAIAGFTFIAIAACVALAGRPGPGAAAPPSPSPSPTQVPTPYMALEQVPNGTWDVIMQGRDISYSTMKLSDVGTTISGSWSFDKKTKYVISGTREGSHLKLDIKVGDRLEGASVGRIDATIDGIADMFGTITLHAIDTPFQAAQHSRVPQPIDTNGPTGTPTPF